MGLAPSPQVGRILDGLVRLQVAGRFPHGNRLWNTSAGSRTSRGDKRRNPTPARRRDIAGAERRIDRGGEDV